MALTGHHTFVLNLHKLLNFFLTFLAQELKNINVSKTKIKTHDGPNGPPHISLPVCVYFIRGKALTNSMFFILCRKTSGTITMH